MINTDIFNTSENGIPVISFPTRDRTIEPHNYPKGIRFSHIFKTTPGRIEDGSGTLPDEGPFIGSESSLVSDQLLNQERGLYFESSNLPTFGRPSTEFIPSNFELDIQQETYYDGTRLNEGLAQQMLVQRRAAEIQEQVAMEKSLRLVAIQEKNKSLMDEANRVMEQVDQALRLYDFNVEQFVDEELAELRMTELNERIEKLLRDEEKVEEPKPKPKPKTKPRTKSKTRKNRSPRI